MSRNCLLLKQKMGEGFRSHVPDMSRSEAIWPKSQAQHQTCLGIVSELFRNLFVLKSRILEAVRSHSPHMCQCPTCRIRSSPPDLFENCFGFLWNCLVLKQIVVEVVMSEDMSLTCAEVGTNPCGMMGVQSHPCVLTPCRSLCWRRR